MKKANENEIIEAIGELRDLMAEQFHDVRSELKSVNTRLDRLEHNQDLHTNVLDKHTKMLRELKVHKVLSL